MSFVGNEENELTNVSAIVVIPITST